MLGAAAAGAAAAGAAASETTGDDRTLNVWTAADDAATGRPAARPKLDLSAAIDARKSYAIPPVEIVAFDVLLNRFNRYREVPAITTSPRHRSGATLAAAGWSTTTRSASTSSCTRTRARCITASRARRA
jgi:hypothetical protein